MVKLRTTEDLEKEALKNYENAKKDSEMFQQKMASAPDNSEPAKKMETAKLEAFKKYEKAMKVIPESAQKEKRESLQSSLDQESRNDTKQVLNNLREHINSQNYLKKLQIELGGDLKKAKEVQHRRIIYLDFVKFSFHDKKDMSNKWAKENTAGDSKWIPQWLQTEIKLYKAGIKNVDAYYNSSKHEIALPKNKDDLSARHEIFHASTRGVYDMTESAKKILEDSYISSNTKEDEYFSRPTERLVRKQQLDNEMEVLGIKKYGEKFTKKHYKKLMEYYNNGKLSHNANEFIERTKPEYFETIFNQVAQNNQEEINYGKA